MKLTLAETFARLGALEATQTQAGAYLHVLCTLNKLPKDLHEGDAMCLCTFLASEQLKTREVSGAKVREYLGFSTPKFFRSLKEVEDLLTDASSTDCNDLDGAFRYNPLPVWSPECEFCKENTLRCWVRAKPIKGRASDKCEPCFMRRIYPCEQSGGSTIRVSSKPRSKKSNTIHPPATEEPNNASASSAQQDPAVPNTVPALNPFPVLTYPPSPSGLPMSPENVEVPPIASSSLASAETTSPPQKTSIPTSRAIDKERPSRKRPSSSQERPDDGKRCKKPKFDDKPQRASRSKASRTSQAKPATAVSIPNTGRRSHTAAASTRAGGPDAEQQYVLFAHDKALDIISHIEQNGCADLQLQVAISDMKAALEALGVFERIDHRSASLSTEVVHMSREILRCAGKDVEKAAEHVGAADIKLKTLLVAFLRRLADLGAES